MFSMVFALIVNMTSVFNAPETHCEVVGPRTDGISVLICDGHVKAMTDADGNTVEYPYSTED